MIITTVSKEKINGKLLFNSIDTDVTRVMQTLLSDYNNHHIQNTVCIVRAQINDALEVFRTSNKIERYFVRVKFTSSKFLITIEYQQKHCFNTSKVVYEVS